MISDAPHSVITGVPGWETHDEQYELLRWALMVPLHGVIVEIGAEFGMSASIFCRGADESVEIYSVDLFPGDLMLRHLENLASAGYVGRTTPIKGDSGTVGKDWKRDIDLLFIDGDHSYNGVWRDLTAWMDHVKPDGVVVFHDAAPITNLNPHPLHLEVQQAIDEYMTLDGDLYHQWTEQDSVDSMRIFKRNA